MKGQEMKPNVCKLDEIDLKELAEFTSIVKTGNADQRDKYAGWFEEELLPLEHATILGTEAGELVGWVLLVVQEHEKVEINPWLLGGHPIVSPTQEHKESSAMLLQEAIKWAKIRNARSINLAVPIEDSESTNHEQEKWYATQGFTPLLKYVEMKCNLSANIVTDISIPEGIKSESLENADENELYACYEQAFQGGDAKFFFTQSDAERRDYFDTLGLEEARGHAASSVLVKDGQLIGFTYVLPYGEKNCHISCMCVHPDYQGLGLGKAMLHTAMRNAQTQGMQSMTLGTETKMRAYHLYRKNGFEVLDGAILFEKELMN